MTVNDVSGKAIAYLGWKEIKLTAPVFCGDTLYAESEVLEKAGIEITAHAGNCHRAYLRL